MKAQILDKDAKNIIASALVCALTVGAIASVANPAAAVTTCEGVGTECTATLDVNVNVDEFISLTLTTTNDGRTSTGTATASPAPTGTVEVTATTDPNPVLESTTMLPNSTNTSMGTTAKVVTNSLTGAYLNVIDSDTTNALTTDDTSYSIPAADGAISAGTAQWNLTVTGATKAGTTAGTATTSFVSDKAVPVSSGTALELYRHAQPATGISASIDDTVTIQYNVATDSTQAYGTYTDTITYTASTI